jgi:hypothetical protein
MVPRSRPLPADALQGPAPTLTREANVRPATSDDDERRRTYRERVRASTACALDEYAATLAKLAK